MEQDEKLLALAEHITNLTDEYGKLLGELASTGEDEQIHELLVQHADWTSSGAAVLIRLARTYGTFVLANALALAETMEIEDGDVGL